MIAGVEGVGLANTGKALNRRDRGESPEFAERSHALRVLLLRPASNMLGF
jgi:hypothetical protein